jgi:hypothetical protein
LRHSPILCPICGLVPGDEQNGQRADNRATTCDLSSRSFAQSFAQSRPKEPKLPKSGPMMHAYPLENKHSDARGIACANRMYFCRVKQLRRLRAEFVKYARPKRGVLGISKISNQSSPGPLLGQHLKRRDIAI